MTLIDVPLYKIYLDYRHADDLDGLAEAVECQKEHIKNLLESEVK